MKLRVFRDLRGGITLGLDEEVPICKAQGKLQPEHTIVCEDCNFLQQRSRWVPPRPNTIWF